MKAVVMLASKRYAFKLKLGQTQIIDITSVDAETVTGYQYQKGAKSSYSATYQSIEKDVAKISVWKYNPYLTGIGIVLVVLPASAIIWALTAW